MLAERPEPRPSAGHRTTWPSSGGERMPLVEIPDVHYARSGGVAIAYQVVGDGPTVVYAPHLCTIDALWRAPHTRAFLDQLTRHVRLIVFNPRGTGLSDRPRGISLESRMDDINAVLDANGAGTRDAVRRRRERERLRAVRIDVPGTLRTPRALHARTPRSKRTRVTRPPGSARCANTGGNAPGWSRSGENISPAYVPTPN